MTLYFWFNNVHFVLEFLGALAFFALGWLAFDTLRVRKDTKQILKGIGFSLIAFSLMLHGLLVEENLPLFVGIVLQLAGLTLVLLVIFLERPPPRPTFSPVLVVLPAVASYLRGVDAASFLVAAAIGGLSWWRYKTERNRYLVTLGFAFLFLAAAYLFSAVFFQEPVAVSLPWILSHLLKGAAFVFLALWLWQYLHTRVREQLLLLFILLAGVIGILVTFSFSPVLLSRIQRSTLAELAAAGKSVEALLGNKAQIAKGEMTLLSQDASFIRALSRSSLREVEGLSRKKAETAGLDFLTVALQNGTVLTRTHTLTVRGDTATDDPLFLRARQSGEVSFDIVDVPPEGLSLRAAAPVLSGGFLVGVVVGGYRLDEISGKRLSETVGHDVTFYNRANEGDEAVQGVLRSGRVFSGVASLQGKSYLLYLFPIKNARGEIAGVAAIREPQVSLSRAVTATNRITFVVTLATLLIILIPAESAFRRVLMTR